MWLFAAFLGPAFYAVANILDTHLTNRHLKQTHTLVFYGSILNLAFLPIIVIFQRPVMPPLHTLPVFALLGVVNIAYLYPYYRGLQSDDTSIAISFFGLGRIVIPVLAFFIVGEVLSGVQYLGIGLIIISSTLISIVGSEKSGFRFSKASYYIALASIIISFEGVLIKYLFGQGLNYATVIGGEIIAVSFVALCLLISKRIRGDVLANRKTFRAMFPIFAAEETFTFLAISAEAYAISIAPVSVVKSITMFTPLFVVLYAFITKKHIPRIFHIFKEHMGAAVIIKKVILFVCMIAGVFLIST